MRQLYSKEFVWIVPNDDNRVEDGRDLRLRFLDEQDDEEIDSGWLGLGCSMLEMLLGVAIRLEFETDISERNWFWHLLDNIGLSRFTDDKYAVEPIDDICDRVIWRTYEPNGRGGLFPLNNPRKDQREVEIWYQLSSYLLERS